ncbi:hypothetical protein Bpfe_013019, partial [Biomphalaria pfeifferi]
MYNHVHRWRSSITDSLLNLFQHRFELQFKTYQSKGLSTRHFQDCQEIVPRH